MQLNDFEQHVVEHILLSPEPGKHAARSAIRHLERAWKLADDMPEVAIFLAITAEEESATALFHSLKRHNYVGAERLRHRNHLHKTALHPFLVAVGKQLDKFPELRNPIFTFNSELSPNGKELLRVRIKMDGPDGDPVWVHPFPPLEFTVDVNGETYDFGPELSQLASEKNATSVRNYMERLANRRNKVLYAAMGGLPQAQDVLPFLKYRKSVVFSHLIGYLLVDPYSKKQLFVQQTLTAFLDMLGLLPLETKT